MSKNVSEPSNHLAEYAIVLPCNQSAFADFISGLLGKPQTIRKFFSGSFIVKKRDIENIFHLVDQRLGQQNDATLIQFTVEVTYDDFSSVTLTSFDDFVTYAEIKPRISTKIDLSWTYLIQFQGRNAPEKQTIELSLSTGYEYHGGPFYGPGFHLRIHHTVRSWGVDLESLISGHINALQQLSRSGFRDWLNARSEAVASYISLFVFFTFLVALYFTVEKFRLSQLTQFRSSLMGGPGNWENVVNILSDNLMAGSILKYIVSILIFVVAVSAVSLFLRHRIDQYLSFGKRSFLLLTRQADEHFESFLSGRKKDLWKIGLTVAGSLCTGVASNYLFQWLTLN